MPELPEVETVRRTLNRLVIGKTVERVSVLLPRIIQYPDDIEEFQMLLNGETIRSVERRGKFLRLMFDNYTLVSHLRPKAPAPASSAGLPANPDPSGKDASSRIDAHPYISAQCHL